MRTKSVAARLAWSFAAVFVLGLLMIGAFTYFELVIEPEHETAHESLSQGVTEVAAEALVIVTLLALAGWAFARRALRPAELLADAADRIHEGNLHEPIAMPGGGAEFEKLAQVLNTMRDRLNSSFQRIQQFTLYASHELKTPLAVLRMEFEKLADDPLRPESDRALFASHLDEIERLASLVDSLTFLTKADAKIVSMASEEVDLSALVISAMEDTKALGSERDITVELAQCDAITFVGDRQRIRQLLVILCDNAVKYANSGGSVTMSLAKENGSAILRISNTGPGIPADEQDNVFDRFYRGSSANADGVQGMGLGLNIAQWIVGEHRGTLTFESDANRTEFVVNLPLT